MRELIRNWLGISDEVAQHDNDARWKFERDVLQELDILNQKVDAIALAVGVDVVADTAGSGVATITRNPELLKEAGVLADYVCAAQEMVDVQINMLRSTHGLIQAFNRKFTHKNGHGQIKWSDASL